MVFMGSLVFMVLVYLHIVLLFFKVSKISFVSNLKCQCIQTYFTFWLIFSKTVEELLANNQQKPANQMFIQHHGV